jgi:predicted deacetylase
MHALCVSIHDVTPSTLPECRLIADAVARLDSSLPLTLLVVPRYHGDSVLTPEYLDWIGGRLARGDELALHGYTHRDDSPPSQTMIERARRSVYTAGEGEFSTLSREDAAARIAQGRDWFARRGWEAQGFVAPAWLASRGTWDALREFDFLYTTTLSRFHVLRPGIALSAPCVVYSTRSAWRRWSSRAWNTALAHACAGMPLVRFGFHPKDAHYPGVMSNAMSLLERLSRDRLSLTKSAFAHTMD